MLSSHFAAAVKISLNFFPETLPLLAEAWFIPKKGLSPRMIFKIFPFSVDQLLTRSDELGWQNIALTMHQTLGLNSKIDTSEVETRV